MAEAVDAPSLMFGKIELDEVLRKLVWLFTWSSMKSEVTATLSLPVILGYIYFVHYSSY